MEYIFTLKYDVGDQRCEPDALVERLGAAGCTDVLVGTGQPDCKTESSNYACTDFRG